MPLKFMLKYFETSVEEQVYLLIFIGFLYTGNRNECQDKHIGHAREVQRKSRSCKHGRSPIAPYKCYKHSCKNGHNPKTGKCIRSPRKLQTRKKSRSRKRSSNRSSSSSTRSSRSSDEFQMTFVKGASPLRNKVKSRKSKKSRIPYSFVVYYDDDVDEDKMKFSIYLGNFLYELAKNE